MNPIPKLRGELLIAAVTLVFSSAAMSADAANEDSGLTAKIGFDRSSGKYGQDAVTVVSVGSLTLTYNAGDYSFDLVAPYIRQSGPGRLVAVPGRTITFIPGPDQKASGQGDVTAGITRYLLNEEQHGVDLDLGATVKFATASVDKGLGTGKRDASVQAVLSRTFGPINTAVTLGYSFVGKPPGQGFKNAYYSSFDTSYQITPNADFGATYSDGAPVVNGLSASRDITVYLRFKPYKGIKVEVYTIAGRSAQSPNHGEGITLAVDF